MRIERTVRRVVLVAFAVVTLVSAAAFADDPCRDPWVSEVGKQVKNQMGYQLMGRHENGDCNINLYGHDWSSKDQLRQQIQQAQSALRSAGLEYYGPYGGDANAIKDTRFNETLMAGNAYVGPASGAPPRGSRVGNRYIWHVQLPRGYVLAISRRCPEGSAASPTGACKGSGF